MDCVSLVLVEVLAALHILLSLTSLLSSSATLIAQRWLLSPPWCAIQGFISYVCVATQLYIVFLCTCYKLYALRHPLASPGRVIRRFIVILVAVILSVMFTSIMGEYYYFSPTLLSCRLSHELGSPSSLLVLASIFFVLPLILTILFNILVLVDSAKKSGRSTRQRDNVRTMFAVCTLCAGSYLPIVVVFMYQTSHTAAPWLVVTALEIFYISTYVNPILYLAISSGFRRFLVKGRRAEQSQDNGAGTDPEDTITQVNTVQKKRTSTAEELKPIPTSRCVSRGASPSPPPLEAPKGVFARAYDQALRKSSVATDYEENWEYYFAS